MFAAVLFLGASNATSVQAIVVIERTVFYRERAAGMYSALPYAFSQVVIEVIYVTIQTLVYFLILYPMIGFEWKVVKVLWFFYYILMCFIYFTMYGMMVAALTPDVQIAAIVTSFFLSLWGLFSGFLIPRPVGDDDALLEVPGEGDVPLKLFLEYYLGFEYDFLPAVALAHLAKSDSIQIREVWKENLDEEFALIRDIVDDYPFIAMDTEFPGVVLRPVGAFKNINDYNYQTLKDNVDMLKLIQLGLTFSDENGNLPTCGTDKYCIWQFNFREFSVSEDIFANDSIELLRQCGIDFKKNNEMGIEANRFGELLMSSGIVLNDNVHWVTFHSGYDFGYLLKLLTCRDLPDTQAGFFDLINMYFPMLYDIKHLMKFCNSLHGGLNKLAELLEVERIGICHQAGSDSLLTSCAFKKLKDNFFNGSTEKYAGVLYGLGVENGSENK
ncbi:hypothetical protein C3L33_15936, partial [Rhododendron williamsianum]